MTAGISIWIGRLLSGLAVLFLLMDGGMKLANLPQVDEAMTALGFGAGLGPGLGVLTLIIAVLYAYPRSSVLGVILMTGLLGGAMAAHLRVGSPVFSHLLFGLYVGALAWAGLWLRDEKLRALFPWRAR